MTETDSTESDESSTDAPQLDDVRRDSRISEILAWKWLFGLLLSVIGLVAVLTYFAWIGFIETDFAATGSVDLSTHITVLGWVVVGAIGLVTLVSIVRVAGIGFVNSVLNALHSIRFEK